jgi:hypothetical protein
MKRSEWLILAAAVIAFAVISAVLWPRAPDANPTTQGLPVPQRGSVAAEFTGEGHPVWLIGHTDGSILVLDALSTHVPFGVNKPTWFCPPSGTFEDPFHGSRYDLFGDRVDGPAPVGLRQFEFEIEGNVIVVVGQPRDRGAAAPGGGAAEPAQACPRHDALVHDYARLPEAGSPLGAQGADDGWHRLRATLIPEPETESGLLCPDAAGDDGCVTVELPGMDQLLTTPPERAEAAAEGWADANWLVHVVDGRIVEIAEVIE